MIFKASKCRWPRAVLGAELLEDRLQVLQVEVDAVAVAQQPREARGEHPRLFAREAQPGGAEASQSNKK